MFGYEDPDDYYETESCKHWLPNVKVPLFCLNAEDDPIIFRESH